MAGEEVSIQRSGNVLIISPKPSQDSWDGWYESFNSMPGELPEREAPQEQQDRAAFE